MKILIINKFLYLKGGAESYVFGLGDALSKNGHEVQFFGMADEKNIVGNCAGSYAERVDLHTKNPFKKASYAFKSIYSASARRQLRKALDAFCPDVCHLNNFNYHLTPSIILEIRRWEKERGRKCAVVYTAHDYQLVCPNHMCYSLRSGNVCEKCLDGKYSGCFTNKCIHLSTAQSLIGATEAFIWKKAGVYKNIDRIICCSEFVKSKLDRVSAFAGKTVKLQNFVTVPEIVAFEKKDYVLYFGRYEKEKGIEALARAARLLPHIKFVFAGRGAMETALQGVSNIENVGFRSGDELARLICEARFTVCPSEWYENCPLSVMESVSLGTPVVASNIGGIPELIRDGVSGELFEAGNAEALAEKINTLWRDSKKLSEYTARAVGSTREKCRNASSV